MSTKELYAENSYIKECKAQIVSVKGNFVAFDQTIFIQVVVDNLAIKGPLNREMKSTK